MIRLPAIGEIHLPCPECRVTTLTTISVRTEASSAVGGLLLWFPVWDLTVLILSGP